MAPDPPPAVGTPASGGSTPGRRPARMHPVRAPTSSTSAAGAWGDGGLPADLPLANHPPAGTVWVSTHGGRQADPVVASADALPEVVEAVGDRVEVYADGGTRSGSGGADGVAAVLGGLSEQLAHTMVLCGLDDVTAVPADTVVRSR